MAVVALIVHPERRRAVTLAHDAADWLRSRGHEVRVPADIAEAVGLADAACEVGELTGGLDLAVSLGGDGTMLRTVDLVCGAGTPVLGVNIGRLGYLTQVEPTDLEPALGRFLAGDYTVEERMTLAVTVDTPSGAIAAGTYHALNEAVAEKPSGGHTVRVAVEINGQFFTTYAADGLIVATPTGSTAYSFSARGPIVSPRQRAIVMTPVSAHMLFDRSLVLDGSESVRLAVIDDRPALLTVDGRELGLLKEGDAIVCTAGAHPARLVTFEPRDFYGLLKTKFGLADR